MIKNIINYSHFLIYFNSQSFPLTECKKKFRLYNWNEYWNQFDQFYYYYFLKLFYLKVVKV